MDLKPSMLLAAKNLEHCLCSTAQDLPYHKFHIDTDYNAAILCYDMNHNLGRLWDAWLRLSDAIGYEIPPDIESAMLRNTRRFFDNPDNLCMCPPEAAGFSLVPPGLDLHSLRENLMTLTALHRYRNLDWAAEQGHRMLQTVQRIARTDCSWDVERLDCFQRLGQPNSVLEHYSSASASSSGRAIEALIWFYQQTSDALAFQLAERFAAYHLAHSISPDGSLNQDLQPDHLHSYLGTLRGLLLSGAVTGQQDYIDAVEATYRVTVPQLVTETGWANHDLGNDTRPEVSSTGDVAQLALWLALHDDNCDFLDDAERIARARIIPSQITEETDGRELARIRSKSNRKRPLGDAEYANVGERIIGAYGGMHFEPHAGKRSTPDVTAAALHTLIDIFDHVAVRSDAGLVVYFHFDKEDDNVSICSERGEGATVRVRPKIADAVLLRVPRWAPRDSVSLTINGCRVEPMSFRGDFVQVPADSGEREIVLCYDLPNRRTRETTRGIEFQFDWRGDEITGVCPNSAFFAFYPTAPECDREYRPMKVNTADEECLRRFAD